MREGRKLSSIIRDKLHPEKFQELHWEGSFDDYLEMVHRNPKVARTAFQRLYDMILSFGMGEYTEFRQKVIHYKIFDDPISHGKDAIFGLDKYLMKLVDVIKAAARGYGPERRIILLHGPVGSSKSTLVRLFKKGLEDYSMTPDGAIYSFYWQMVNEDDSIEKVNCPMHEDPLRLIPEGVRGSILTEVNHGRSEEEFIRVEGDLCPVCRFYYNALMDKYKGDWERIISNVRVKKLTLSEKDRVGIGTFQPKDEKNQDSTELTGDINYRKIALYGSDSDPRAFNFDGELNVANRGIVEFIEVLKLDVAFLYDLLGATQEHKIKPKKFSQVDIDEVIIGHTNEPEYKKLLNNEYMEALRDRTIKIDVPYITKLSDEIKIYQRDFNSERIKGKHIAPHTLEIASMWTVLTRLEEPKKAGITLMQKLKLYDGKLIPGFTEDTIRELKKESEREGMEGISPRYIQDKISKALVSDVSRKCVNPFMVISEIEGGLVHHSLISSEAQRRRFKELLTLVRQEYEEIIKNEVQRAIAADEEAIARLFGNYIDNVKAYIRKEKIKNPFTGEDEEPEERLMRSIEDKIDIPESRKDDFRREVMNYIAALALEGKRFDYKSNERLRRALELKLFEDQKDSIKLTSLVTNVIDKATQEKIDIVKSRLIRDYGYCESCSSDVLTYVASIFARGDIKEHREHRR
ncbi:MAG: serine protein kinase PrkA, serine protein kinase [Candidatus Dadabacteria bacterium CSP1-2]|nr:MAG: serine protein kinase PrkA, serine protein kinase [Candidatus Dadabacteria bacterium CSP1-2]